MTKGGKGGGYVGDIVAGDEYLRDGLLEHAKELIPEGDEPALADRGEGLLLADGAFLGSGKVHAVESHPDSAGGDDHDAVAQGAEGAARLDEGGERRELGKVGRFRLENTRGACLTPSALRRAGVGITHPI